MKNKKFYIVGVSGNIGAGKDTVADCFVRRGFVKMSLADPMKRFAYQVFEFTEDQLWGPSDYRNVNDPRYTSEDLTEWVRAEYRLADHADTWIREILPAIGDTERREAIESLFQWFQELLTHHTNLSPRVCLQLLGTEWGRNSINEDLWVSYAQQVSRRLASGEHNAYDRLLGSHKTRVPSKYTGVVIPDIRFKNELYMLKNAGHHVVRVTRPGTDDRASGIGVAKHASEMEQLEFNQSFFDTVFINNQDLEHFLRVVDAYVTLRFSDKEIPLSVVEATCLTEN